MARVPHDYIKWCNCVVISYNKLLASISSDAGKTAKNRKMRRELKDAALWASDEHFVQVQNFQQVSPKNCKRNQISPQLNMVQWRSRVCVRGCLAVSMLIPSDEPVVVICLSQYAQCAVMAADCYCELRCWVLLPIDDMCQKTKQKTIS